jgi:hypothetical protein
MRILRSRKGKISLMLACLIILAITVTAFVVAYMFMSGAFATLLSGEKVTVLGATIAGTRAPYYVGVSVEQTGGPQAVVKSLIIKDSAGNTVAVLSGDFMGWYTTVPLTQGKITEISAYYYPNNMSPKPIEIGKSYTVTVVTTAGASFVSPLVVATG